MHRVARPIEGVDRGPAQTIGVELGPRGVENRAPAEEWAKINQIDPASDPHGRSVRFEFFHAPTHAES